MTIDGRVHPPEGIDLSTDEFWARPLAERSAGFAQLRALGQPAFFTDPETPFTTPDQGYYALVSHADITEASRHPELFSSARGSTSIVDLPVEFNEYFGSMINMDDPRHARLRRIVSRAFTPKMIKRFEEDVQRDGGGDRGRPDRDGAVRLRGARLGPAAPEDHLRDDGHRRRALRDGAAQHQHHPVGLGPGVRQPRTWTRPSGRS